MLCKEVMCMGKTQHFDVRFLTRTAILLALTLAVQMMGFPQFITGPGVNAMLMLSAIYVGPVGGVAIGALTPWIAFMRGILPPPLGPAIPFIMLGNASIVIVFWLMRRVLSSNMVGSVVGVIVGSIAKYFVIAAAVQFLLDLPPGPSAKLLQISQLFTALIGGIIAIIIERVLQRNVGRDLSME